MTPDSPQNSPAHFQAHQSQANSQAASSLSPSPETDLTWRNPPEPIAGMLDAPRSPVISFSPDHQWILELSIPALPPLQELAQPKLPLGGIEINPQTWGPAKESFYVGLALRPLHEPTAKAVVLPEAPRIRNLSWSRDSRHLAFTLSGSQGLSLWLLDIATGQAKALTGPILNATYGIPYRWLPSGEGFICKVRPDDIGPPPEADTIPSGPVIQENQGRLTPTRTYTNLLKNAHDEALLDYYFSSVLEHIDFNGNRTPLQQTPGNPGLILSAQPSPDGNWILLITLHRPYSYQLTLRRFPTKYTVLDRSGKTVRLIADLPLADAIPTDFEAVRQGRRWVGWRADQAATLYWPEALDGGDARQDVAFRDAIYQWPAPFTTDPNRLWKTTLRFRGIVWGNESLALGYEAWYDSRESRTWQLNPLTDNDEPRLLNARNFQDAYSNPGKPVLAPGPYGWQTLLLAADGNSFYLQGRGTSPEGVFPFLDRLTIPSHAQNEQATASETPIPPQPETQRLWQATASHFERASIVIDADATKIITQRQSQTEPPNYFQRVLGHSKAEPPSLKALTHFPDPLPWYANLKKELVRYKRSDGLELSAVLYLPPNYNGEETLPMLLWVYPEEHKSRDTASQVTTAENTFSRPNRTSVLFLLTQGYGVLLGPSMPIIGEAEAEPNDTYIEQLVDSADAAVEYLVQRGVGDRQRMAIGGHSYGAFTTANLLAHCDLFQAGIARSGAYNRTLTPFGFQGEQRNFWQATDTYINISPFSQADKIKAPLLLIHGEEDNNAGTYPLQSDRLYEAMKGLGGTVRYVSLPYEGHSYRSREANGHVLWEMVRWLDRHLSQKPASMPSSG